MDLLVKKHYFNFSSCYNCISCIVMRIYNSKCMVSYPHREYSLIWYPQECKFLGDQHSVSMGEWPEFVIIYTTERDFRKTFSDPKGEKILKKNRRTVSELTCKITCSNVNEAKKISVCSDKLIFSAWFVLESTSECVKYTNFFITAIGVTVFSRCWYLLFIPISLPYLIHFQIFKLRITPTS